MSDAHKAAASSTPQPMDPSAYGTQELDTFQKGKSRGKGKGEGKGKPKDNYPTTPCPICGKAGHYPLWLGGTRTSLRTRTKAKKARTVWPTLAINLRIEGRWHELRAAHTSSHGHAWFHLRLVDSQRFVHREKNMQAYVHGRQFRNQIECAVNYDLFEQLKVHMWAKSEGVLGPDHGQGDVREVVCFEPCLPMVSADEWTC